MDFRLALRAVLAAALTLTMTKVALACMSPDFEDHHAPVCHIPMPAPDDIVAFHASAGRTALSDLHLGYPNLRTRVVDLHVAPNNDTHYLMLTASDQTIWRITGATETIDRVIVVGARAAGSDGAGVIGIPAERVHFTNPDLSALEGIWNTSCTRISQICVPAQWFAEEVRNQLTFHPARPPDRLELDMLIRTEIIPRRDEPTTITRLMPDVPDQMLSLDASQIASPTPPAPYPQLPGAPGLEALVANGALLRSDHPEARALIDAYGARFSDRYRSRFDPQFGFVPDVDYVVTREVTLPPQLPPTALLVVAGVPPPEFNGNRPYSVCYFREEDADMPVVGYDPFSELCRAGGVSRRMGDDQSAILRAGASYDELESASAECRLDRLPRETHVVVLSVTDRNSGRYAGDAFRDVIVDVQRAGPVALYLAQEGGPIRWQITGSDVVEVYARLPERNGLDAVVLNGHPYSYSRLVHEAEDCPRFPPLWPTRLGPAIAHLDLLFERLEGQGIDDVIAFDSLPDRIVID